jgi:hypothetical protein
MLKAIVLGPICASLILFTAGPGCRGQSTGASTAPAPQQRDVNVLSKLRATVGFLRVGFKNENGEDAYISGTCFFAFYPDERLGSHVGFDYLITNRHMAVPGIDTGTPHEATWIGIRLNLKTSNDGIQSKELILPIGGNIQWHFPSDDAVDLAVIQMSPNQDIFDIAPIPIAGFATKETVNAQGISEGDPLWFAGYFTGLPGQTKIQPVLRQGMIAMMPSEKVETVLHRTGRLFVADMHTTKGNSGSPCFISIGGLRNGALSLVSQPTYMLLGLVSGYYTENSDFDLQVAAAVQGRISGNSGLTLIVPADEIKSFLDSPQLQSLRDALVAPKSNGH